MPRTPEVRAAGGVLWRPGPGGAPEVVVVHRPRYDDWSLPKGRLDDGEHPLEAAVREVREETGHGAVAQQRLGTSSYEVLVGGQARPKTVQWWALRATGEQGPRDDEVDDLRWLPVEDARALLTAGRDSTVLDAFAAAPPDLAPLVLVRHAHAGDRSAWAGDDAARPLSDRGRAQAARLAALLPLHGVRALVSAPPLRCRQTLAPLADALGLPVRVEDLLGDAGQAARPDDAAALVRSLPTGTVACSQGDALPALLPALGAQQGPVRKGSARVLWRDGDRLVADDLLDPEEPGEPGRAGTAAVGRWRG